MENNYKEMLRHIHTFCFDVDGVFTNNIVYLHPAGEQVRTANVRDGYAVQLAVKKGFRIIIISGGVSEGVQKRFEGLGATEIHLGASEKLPVLERVLMKYRILPAQVCYMGDDIPDLRVMKHVGLPVCPADAVPEIKEISKYISPYGGGMGCVRDVLEQALKVQGKWLDEDGHKW